MQRIEQAELVHRHRHQDDRAGQHRQVGPAEPAEDPDAEDDGGQNEDRQLQDEGLAPVSYAVGHQLHMGHQVRDRGEDDGVMRLDHEGAAHDQKRHRAEAEDPL